MRSQQNAVHDLFKMPLRYGPPTLSERYDLALFRKPDATGKRSAWLGKNRAACPASTATHGAPAPVKEPEIHTRIPTSCSQPVLSIL